MHAYSPFIATLYDQQEPVGKLGRGAHYSVLRALVWHDEHLKPLARAQFIDFAVIWDEDHDVRVIEVVEQMLFAGLLAPVRFIGERKGCLTIIVSASQMLSTDEYHVKVGHFGPADDDAWCIEVFDFCDPNAMGMIINDSDERVRAFLSNIANLHRLGLESSSSAGDISDLLLDRERERERERRWPEKF